MTVKEVSEILSVSQSTVRKWMRILFPGIMKTGKKTYLNELHVTCIKQRIYDINGHIGAVTIVTPSGGKFLTQYKRRDYERITGNVNGFGNDDDGEASCGMARIEDTRTKERT
jgi:DNA-binding transcriptional ArsR family regulator